MKPKVTPPLTNLDLPGIEKISSGKVREIFGLKNSLLLVASDRVSAFDVVLPDPIPWKGTVLTQTAAFWFRRIESEGIVKHHLITVNPEEFPPELEAYKEVLAGRTSLVHRCEPLPVECVVRGYLAGSGWKEYQEGGEVCGIQLPEGLVESDQLPEPIFTPATKAVSGHDENIPFERAAEILGEETAASVRNLSLTIYEFARQLAASKGIIICDTKFEFGLLDGELVLIDEVLTPDSSRFWPADDYEPGRSQKSFDKQFIRDYLETLDWDKKAPGPELPTEVLRRTSEKYLEAYRLLTGEDLEDKFAQR